MPIEQNQTITAIPTFSKVKRVREKITEWATPKFITPGFQHPAKTWEDGKGE